MSGKARYSVSRLGVVFPSPLAVWLIDDYFNILIYDGTTTSNVRSNLPVLIQSYNTLIPTSHRAAPPPPAALR